MKFKVGDRVTNRSLHWGLGMTGEVTRVEGAQNEVVWSYPACHTFTQMESDEFLELVEETTAVPRSLLEQIHLVLDHSEGETVAWDGKLGKCREDSGLLL